MNFRYKLQTQKDIKKALTMLSGLGVIRLGLEPRTLSLKGRCSTS